MRPSFLQVRCEPPFCSPRSTKSDAARHGHPRRLVHFFSLLLLVAGLCHAKVASAQLIAPGPGTQDSPRRSYETETGQVGGQGWYYYSRIGALRCSPGEAIVGADFADDGRFLTGIRLHCATVSCAGAICAWDSGSVHDGPSVGATVPQGGPDCPLGSVVAGFGSQNVGDAPDSVVLRCARLVGTPSTFGRTQTYPIIWPRADGTAITPRTAGGSRPGAAGAYRATMAEAPGAYGSIQQRSNYYAAMNDILQHAPGTRDIRFFEAASQVTDSTHVGAVEGLGFFVHQADAVKLLETVNQVLFEGNMQVLRKLLIAGVPYGDPTSVLPPPSPPTTRMPYGGHCDRYAATAISVGIVRSGAIQALSLYCGSGAPDQAVAGSSCRPSYPAMRFDLAMVDYEQNRVQGVLDDSGMTAQVAGATQDIDRDMNLNGDAFRPLGAWLFGMMGSLDRTPFLWAGAYRRKSSLTFLSLQDRVAIGKALIFQLHDCTVMDYASYMSNATAH
jgi:hypothetical protein